MAIPFRILKRAFVPAQDPNAQAAGPGGAPADPTAGAPMDPQAAGAAAGAMPQDPTAGAAPQDPSAPVDPAATGQPAADAAAADPAAAAAAGNPGMAPPPDAPEEPIDQNAAVNHGQARVVMDIVERTLSAVGKNKKNQPPAGAGAAGGGAPAPDPAQAGGPITGLPGDMSSFQGPIKAG